MKLLILGATGRIGREVVDLALLRGHTVTAYVRSPEKVASGRSGLTVRKGNALDVNGLAGVLTGQDAVISSLGLPSKQALRPSTFMAESMATTVAAMHRAGVRRVAAVSAAVLYPLPGIFYAFFRWLLEHHARDLRAMEQVLQATELDWTIVRPPRLVRGAEAPVRLSVDGLPAGGREATFRSVASVLVDSVERHSYSRRIVGLCR